MKWRRVILVAVCAGAIAGCGRVFRRADGGARLRLRAPEIKLHPAEPRVDTVLGTVLVMPVVMDGPVPGDETVPARMDDGRKVQARLSWVSVRDDGSMPGWLPGAGVWTATPASAGSRPSANGSWVLTAELPMDAVGQGLHVGGGRVVLNWLPDPALIRPREGEGPWYRPFGDSPPESLMRLAAPESESPVRRWRHRLITRGLEPESGTPMPVAQPGKIMRREDPVLAALARQTEARWQVALATLWSADADLAERVKRRLCAAVDFGGGMVAPAWPTESTDLDALLSDLLSRRLDAAQKAERATLWLEGQAPGAAWVVDDAGLRDAPSGRAVATCGVANLTERTTLAWASSRAEAGAPAATNLPAQGAALLPVAAPPPVGLSAAGVPVEVHAGRWSVTRMAAMERLPLTPPGLRADGMVGDWTMRAWLNGSPDESMTAGPDGAAWAGVALVQRREPDTTGGPVWWVYLECRSPGMTKESKEEGRESVRVWIGARGSPSAVLRVSSAGVIVDEAGVGQDVQGGTVMRDAGKWVANVPIPARCVEADGTLRIAIERTDSRGRRTSWPRPMLPWDAEPGRIALDTTAWGGASAAK